MSEQYPRLGAVIVCAGSARRMGGIDKLTVPLNGAPLVTWSLRALEALWDKIPEKKWLKWLKKGKRAIKQRYRNVEFRCQAAIS